MHELQTGYSRRQMLRSMSSGFGYLAFAAMAARSGQWSKARGAEAGVPNPPAKSGEKDQRDALTPRAPHFRARAKRVIFLCMKGGPSHVDLFDYKPELQKASGKLAPIGRKGAQAKLLGSPMKFSQAASPNRSPTLR